MDPLGEEFLAVLDVRVGGVADHHAGRLEAFRCYAGETLGDQQFADAAAEFLLFAADLVKTVGLGFQHHVAQGGQGIGRHRRVVGVAAVLESFHDLQPFFQVAGETAAGRPIDSGARPFAQGDQGAARRGTPALLRGADQDVDIVRRHVHPDRAGGDAVENEQTIDSMDRGADGAQVVVGQDHARGSFDVRGEDNVRLVLTDGGDNLFDRGRREGRLGAAANLAGLEHGAFGGNAAHLENLRPAETEPAVADDQHLLAGGELAGHRFHAESAAARHDDGGLGVIDLLENA